MGTNASLVLHLREQGEQKYFFSNEIDSFLNFHMI